MASFSGPPEVPDGPLDRYLERLSALLVGLAPASERRRLREETAFHLERLAEDGRARGLSPEDAFARAVDAYGSPVRVAEEFLEGRFRRSARTGLARRLGPGATLGLAAFGTAQLVCVALFQLRVFLPADSVWRWAVDPAAWHDVFPRSLPAPEATPLYGLTLLAAVVSPVAAGAFVGSRVPVRPARSAYHAAAPCVLYSLVMAALLRPMQEMLAFAVFQALWWTASGAGSATVAHALAARARFRREAERCD